nr:MAG TPA: hypothetical protein [Caudoviricetes sp.]
MCKSFFFSSNLYFCHFFAPSFLLFVKSMIILLQFVNIVNSFLTFCENILQ